MTLILITCYCYTIISFPHLRLALNLFILAWKL